jgi:hypothetical protein
MRSASKPDKKELSGERKIITDKLVVEKTGRPMEHWFLHLDKKGARDLTHDKIYKLIASTAALKELGEWNQNLLCTSYEWSRGMKQRGERPDGYEISSSKTFNVPVEIVYRAWIDEAARKKWLREKIVIRKATENKSARITWPDSTSLSVEFYVKGETKCQVVVQHQKIGTFDESAALKLFWKKKLEDLETLLTKI